MSFDPLLTALLDKFARAIVSGEQPDVTFEEIEQIEYEVEHEQILASQSSEGAQYLAEQVERISKNRLTVRPADISLFKCRLKGVCMYIVRCPFNTPAGEVTELTEGMSLIIYGLYEGKAAIDLHARQA
jgi:hypothetical protein